MEFLKGFDARQIAACGKPIAFTDKTYREAFTRDMQNARRRVIVCNPFLTAGGIARSKQLIDDALARGVHFCAFLAEPDDWHRRASGLLEPETVSKLKTFESILDLLISKGIHINLRPGLHQKLCVFDHEILWSGSLNFWSHWKTDEHLSRQHDRLAVAAVIRMHRLDVCAECAVNSKLVGCSKNEARLRLKQLEAALVAQREALGVTQTALAAHVGTQQAVISYMERGTRDISPCSLVQIGGSLGYQLTWIPEILLPAVEDYVCNRLAELNKIALRSDRT